MAQEITLKARLHRELKQRKTKKASFAVRGSLTDGTTFSIVIDAIEADHLVGAPLPDKWVTHIPLSAIGTISYVPTTETDAEE